MEKRNTHLKIDPLNYSHTLPNFWEGRIDGIENNELRLHQVMQCFHLLEDEEHILSQQIEKKEKIFGIIGFSCDEGVKRNQGRTGASRGPDFIRKNLKNLPIHKTESLSLWDFGNIVCTDGNLERAQENLSNFVEWALNKGIFPLVLGGGHEVTYGHVKGIKQFLLSKGVADLSALNLDAHFDNRECVENVGTSGTGFYQLMKELPSENLNFNYFAWGIQRSGNTPILFERAINDKVQYLLAEDFHFQNLEKVNQFFDQILRTNKSKEALYFTIDLDGFRMDNAPGVSAPSALGISPDNLFLLYFKKILQSGRLISLDIAELNPEYDIDERTAKLAAQLIFLIIHETQPHQDFFNLS